MANRAAGHMTNDLLRLMGEMGVFRHLGEEGTRSLIHETSRLANRYDASLGDVFDEIGPALGICPDCCRPTFDPSCGTCSGCHFTGETTRGAWARSL